jgi:hypothetical protein
MSQPAFAVTKKAVSIQRRERCTTKNQSNAFSNLQQDIAKQLKPYGNFSISTLWSGCSLFAEIITDEWQKISEI